MVLDNSISLDELKNKIIKNENRKVLTFCGNCGKKVTAANPFCNNICKEAYFEYTKVQVSQKFLKRIYTTCTKEEREIEIKKFSIFHQYNSDAVNKKIRNEAIRHGYVA